MSATVQSVKQTAHQLIDGLPEGANWKDIIYELSIMQDIEDGLADSEADDSAVLIRSESGITVNNYTYTEAQEIIDNGALSTELTIDITTVRGSLDSLESFSHTVIRTV